MNSTPGSWSPPGLQGLNAPSALKVHRRMLAGAPTRLLRSGGGSETAFIEGSRPPMAGKPFLHGAQHSSWNEIKDFHGYYCPHGHFN
jgi:hypothetical protein